MPYLYNYYTTTGNVKKVNQDAVFVMEAETAFGNVLFAAISDGMGGLAKGEEASKRMLERLQDWFSGKLPEVLYDDQGITEQNFRRTMLQTIQDACDDIANYATSIGSECGTTLAGILLCNDKWFVVNVGDSRVYHHNGVSFEQITKDQSYVQREIDAGRMTADEAKHHKMRSILLQCIGASDVVIPDWYSGEIKGDDVFMICSDGFRHVISENEFCEIFEPDGIRSKENIYQILDDCAQRSMNAGERDNISAIVVKVVGKREEVTDHAGDRLGNRWEV